MKKLEGQIAEEMKEIIQDGDTAIEIEGKKYSLFLTEEPETTITEDVKADPELKEKLLQAKKDILNGRTFMTEEVMGMINQGEV